MATDDFVPTEHNAADPHQEPYAPRTLWHKPTDAAPADSHDEAPEDEVALESDLDLPVASTDEAGEVAAFDEPDGLVVTEDLVFDEESVFDEAPATTLPDEDELPESEAASEGELAEAPADFSHVDPGEAAADEEPTQASTDIAAEIPAATVEHAVEADELPAVDSQDQEPASEDAAWGAALDDDAADEGSAEAELFDAAYDSVDEAAVDELPSLPADAALAEQSSEEVAEDIGEEATEEPVEVEDLQEGVEDEADTPEARTTTIPVTDVNDDEDFTSSTILPEDVLEARDHDNPSTTAIRRDLMSAYDEEEAAQPASWESALAASTEAAAKRPRRAALSGETPESLDDAIFEGATVVPVVPSRASSHIMSVFLGLIFIPVAWFFFADAGARMLYPGSGPADSGTLDATALLEFASGIVALVIVLLLLLRSSLGAWVWGVVLTLVGIPWLVVPGIMRQHTESFFIWMSNTGGVIGTNLANNIQRDAYSGRLLLLGLTLLGVAIVAVSVRRRGRAEEAVRARVEKVNPDGAHFTARERRRATKRKK